MKVKSGMLPEVAQNGGFPLEAGPDIAPQQV